MEKKLVFCSLNKEWCDEMRILFPEATVVCGDVRTIPRKDTAFISPANCLGFMDGGIDMVFSRQMFPGCEKLVRERIKQLGFKTALGRHYFPIGSAFVVTANTATNSGLICCPTMFLPHDVSTTQNAFHSFLAALLVWQKVGIYRTLVATSHCCGYGKMTAAESARQMRRAYDVFVAGGEGSKDSSSDPTVVAMPNRDLPDNFDNREIKEI